jgi:AcrR family transcriptional regulator
MRTVKPLRAEHAEVTRKEVLASARTLFAARGYDAVLLDEIAAAARVTKGAIYHHFENKRDLFRTVYEELAGELEARVRRRMARGTNPLERADLAIDAFLDCADDDAIRSIMFRDGMTALAGECRVIDEQHYLGLLREILDELAAAGVITDVDTGVTARLLLGGLIEGTRILGDPERPRTARAALRTSLRKIVAGLAVRLP